MLALFGKRQQCQSWGARVQVFGQVLHEEGRCRLLRPDVVHVFVRLVDNLLLQKLLDDIFDRHNAQHYRLHIVYLILAVLETILPQTTAASRRRKEEEEELKEDEEEDYKEE